MASPCGRRGLEDRAVSLLNLPNNHKLIEEDGANVLIQRWIGNLRSNTANTLKKPRL